MPVKADEWKIDDPFEMTELEEDGKKKLYGRGTTDDKGPVLGWLCIIEAFKHFKKELPVNIKVRVVANKITQIHNRLFIKFLNNLLFNSISSFALKEWKKQVVLDLTN